MSAYKVITLSGSDPALNPYLAMIYSDFLLSLRYGNSWFSLIDQESYYKIYRQVIDQVLSRHTSEVRLACLVDDLDTCLGWSLSEGYKLHYVYVKEDFHRQGIARSLVPKDFDRITHLTRAGKAIWQEKLPHVLFNPFLI